MSLPSMHGPITESDHEDATLFWIRIPIGFVSAMAFLFAPSMFWRGTGLIFGLTIVLLPRKYVDIIGGIIYAILAVKIVLMILVNGT